MASVQAHLVLVSAEGRQDVDYGLCGDAGDGGAADMMQLADQVATDRQNGLSLGLEKAGPSRVVLSQDDCRFHVFCRPGIISSSGQRSEQDRQRRAA